MKTTFSDNNEDNHQRIRLNIAKAEVVISQFGKKHKRVIKYLIRRRDARTGKMLRKSFALSFMKMIELFYDGNAFCDINASIRARFTII
jgi:hypothetical protein